MIVKAVMVPHPPIAVPEIGRGEEKKIQPTLAGYAQAAEAIAQAKPDTIILTSPHATMYRDYFQISPGSQAYGDFGQFRAPQVSFDVPYDNELTALLNQMLQERGFPAGTDYERDAMLDHGTMVPLYFLRQKYQAFRLVRIGLSGLPLTMHYQLGMIIREAVDRLGRRAAFIASGDLAHCQKADGPYGYHQEGPEYDRRIMADMAAGNFGRLLEYDETFCEKAMECGHRSFVIMAGALDRTVVTPHRISHEATFGVGYGIVIYDIGGPDASRNFLDQYQQKQREQVQAKQAQEDPYVALARASLTSWIKQGKKLPVPADLPAELLSRQAGAFVSLHENGSLRGCIGTILATKKNLAQEIISNAISASTRDPRFEPVRAEELPYLDISVDVLSAPQEISDRSLLDVKRYGVICSCGGRQGLLLPDLDGVDTVDQQIRIACQKGGIDPEEEDVRLQRFEVVRHV